jgi:hypothetical protein
VSGLSNSATASFQNLPAAGSDFVNSNSVIAKFAFLLMVIIVFVLLLNLAMRVVTFFMSPPSNPYLVYGMLSGTNGLVIPQDPKNPNAVPIYRSNNEETGLEFTWSVWLNVSDPGANSTVAFQNIFNKGNGSYVSYASLASAATTAVGGASGAVDSVLSLAGVTKTTSGSTVSYSLPATTDANVRAGIGAGLNAVTTTSGVTNMLATMGLGANQVTSGTGKASVNNGPGLYVVTAQSQVSLVVVMDTVDSLVPTQMIQVDQVPINKWFHLAIRMENTMMDVYVNGTIVGRAMLAAVPRQNYNDVNVCQNGGFTGFLSNLQYFGRALSATQINNVVRAGPNTAASKSSAQSVIGSPYYISDSWFVGKLNAAF